MKKRYKFEFTVEFQTPIPLTRVEEQRAEMLCKGVYFIVQGTPPAPFEPTDERIAYIGKAFGETVFSRVRKHIASVKDARSSSGAAKTRPGRRFIEYRETIQNDPSHLWLVVGRVHRERRYAIGCMEDYFLFKFHRAHGRLPSANTA